MAYGTNAPFGLRPMNSLAGGSWTEKVNEYKIYANADGTSTYAVSLFTGDPVQWGTSIQQTAAANGLIGTIARFNPNKGGNTPATFVGAPILGVFMGCKYQAANSVATTPYVTSPYWPASTQVKPGSQIIAYVLDDPNVIFDIQVSSSINAGDIGAGVINFFAPPVFPNTNVTGASVVLCGTFGRNFALNIGGGSNFDTILPANTIPVNTTYADNPAAGNTLSGQSAFYLDVNTSASGTGTGATTDYNKDVVTLPLKAIAYTLKPENQAAAGASIGTTPFINVTVVINNHVYGKGSTAPVYVA